VFGAPAEEQLISRPISVRDGYFDDVDVALTPHVGQEFNVGYGLLQTGLISAVFTFHGETAHAGVAPWKGRDALDAVVLMDVGMASTASTCARHAVPARDHQRRQPTERGAEGLPRSGVLPRPDPPRAP